MIWKTHELKIDPEHFNKIINHGKPFEIRKNDRNYKINDYLLLKEYDRNTNEYTGRETRVAILDIFDNQEYLKENFILLIITRPL